MRTITQLFIALSIFACFAASTPACYFLNNEKELCQAASSICTWTDDPAWDICEDNCTLYSKVASDCIATKGCAFTPNTCTFQTTCATAAPADCRNANNCVYTAATCSFNPWVNFLCNNAGACLNPLPAYCSKTTTRSCIPDASPTGTCAQGVATPAACTAPCSTATAVATCTNVCSGLAQVTCGQGAAAAVCTWANNTCSLNTGLADCSTVVANCAANDQCVAGTVYNCSTTQASLNTFCAPAIAGSACTNTQKYAWCITANTDICDINQNYCDFGKPGNGCGTDSVNCSTTQASCDTLDNQACTWSATSPICNQNVCTGSFSSCQTATQGGCRVSGSGCTPDDSSCQFRAGGKCEIKYPDTI